MGRKLRKGISISFFSLALLLLAGVAVNWILIARIENALRKELSQTIIKATDGFYQFTYKDLSVGFWDGELKINKIELKPDTAVYQRWAEHDSLPETYLNLSIDYIHFKGVNLAWKFNFVKLNFELFEIHRPTIEIHYTRDPGMVEEKDKEYEFKTLYEMLPPFIHEVSVETMNLNHANITCITSDSISSTRYSLENAAFHAYSFRLDSLSSKSGKLLYCDNFDFSATQPQVLLSNDLFSLNTQSIQLSTVDSIIMIVGAKLVPQTDSLTYKLAKSYIKSAVDTIAVRGIAFTRINSKSHLEARLFAISSPEVEIYTVVNKNADKLEKQKNEREADEATEDNRPFSLYRMFSPILSSILIHSVRLDQAKFQYSIEKKTGTDVYQMKRLDLLVQNFLIDSLSEKNKQFLYAESFGVLIDQFNGTMPSKNHVISFDRLELHTGGQNFRVDNIKLSPFSTHTSYDYLDASITSIQAKGLSYEQGITVNQLTITRPQVSYYRISDGKKQVKTTSVAGNKQNVIDLLSPFLNHLLIREINLSKGYFSHHDLKSGENEELKNLNFYATDFLMNEETINRSLLLPFHFGKAEVKNFDNWFFKGKYHLLFSDLKLTNTGKDIQLKDVSFSSPDPDVSFSILTPQIEVKGFDYEQYFNTGIVSVDAFKLIKATVNRAKPGEGQDSLHASVDHLLLNSFFMSDSMHEVKLKQMVLSDFAFLHKQNESRQSLHLKEFRLDDVSWSKELLSLGLLNIISPSVSLSLANKDSIPTDSISVKKDLYDRLKNYAGQMKVADLEIADINLDYTNTRNGDNRKQAIHQASFGLEGLAVNNETKKLAFTNIHLNMQQLSLPVDSGMFTLEIGGIDLTKHTNELTIDRIHLKALYPKMEFSYKHPRNKDWFDVTVGQVKLSGIDYPASFANHKLQAKSLLIKDVQLDNLKNQQIIVPHLSQPMIYEGLQKLPLKLNIADVNVQNFNVVYEELPKEGVRTGKILFSNLNGHISNFTNVASTPGQFLKLDIDGIFMDSGFFTAVWQIPIDRSHDQFLLDAHMPAFDLRELNQIFIPLASAEVKSGLLKNMTFAMDASSIRGNIRMLLLYNDLNVNFLKNSNKDTPNKFISSLANRVVRDNNPSNETSKPREPDLYIERDPYHSTFNYFWQLLRPPLVETVGIPKSTQDFGKGVSSFFQKVKKFFRFGKEENEQTQPMPESFKQ
ncbi:hypothetical protein [Parabacteroides sp. Marseille-P3160]|uniref:hypothetical protein n=1 Tax=Parabacteroides sp. Marseille-P3160 TaxID=1917887 RepID=UPI0009BC4F2E|nr:hypothetical protein [Parabacteroides sp. Marseille-P3160]